MRLAVRTRTVRGGTKLTTFAFTELFYKDFFEPPRTSAPPRPKKTPTSPKKAGTVRFHEEVRVKKIKAKGKNLPLNTMDDDSDEEDDEEDGYGDFGDLGGETGFGEMDDGSDEGEEDGDEGSEPDSDGDSEGSSNGAETIERLKGDLFAEEEDEPLHGTLFNSHLCLRSVELMRRW